jgi:adenylate cyclase, class 2
MTEVELKARVRDVEATRARLAAFARKARDFDKRDEYWAKGPETGEGLMAAEDSGRAFRIRQDLSLGPGAAPEAVAYVTFKNKSRSGGVERNEEHEFTVSDGGEFAALAARLGARAVLRKRKRGEAWICGDLTIELCEVEGLGWFLEIEALVPSGLPRERAEAECEAATGRIRDALCRAGLAESDIEGRYYADLLAEAGLASIP